VSNKEFSSLRVVEQGICPSIAYAGKLFADLGSDVLKVEPLTGDPLRSKPAVLPDVISSDTDAWFLYLNARKKSVGLDLKVGEGRRVFDRMLETADVLFQSSRDPGLETLDLAPHQLAQRFPHLVVVSVTPYGWKSERRYQPAEDLTLQAIGGISIGIGEAGRPPLKLPGNQSAYQAGVSAAIAAFGALLGSRGCFVDVAVADIWAGFYTGVDVANAHFGRSKKGRAGHRVHRAPYPRTIFACKDGYFAIQCTSRRHWQGFLSLVGREDLAEDPMFANRVTANDRYGDEADALFEPWFKERTKEEILELTLKLRIPGAPVYKTSEVVRHPHLQSRKYFRDVEFKGNQVKVPAPLYPRQDVTIGSHTSAPTLGEHTSTVLTELGFGEGDEARMREAGAI
jgi:crotonobetainyl-CoA:carnitine CoA-transferase CaiB-like acyl-CoA transferase